MKTFLNKFAYQSVTGDDFLKTIKEVCKKYHSKETINFAVGMAKDFFEMVTIEFCICHYQNDLFSERLSSFKDKAKWKENRVDPSQIRSRFDDL